MNRSVLHSWQGFRTTDGAGVSLVRVLGHDTAELTAPFLMLDSFDSTNYDAYKAGFPLHPHRGIETISYIASGAMQHRDSLGHADTVGAGEVQWMCAGSGILHEENMPPAQRLLGVQLWLNLPRKDKMCSPTYTAIHRSDIPTYTTEDSSVQVRVLSGTYTTPEGHVLSGHKSNHVAFNYLELVMKAGATLEIPVHEDWCALSFTLEGTMEVQGPVASTFVGEKTAVLLGNGDTISLRAVSEGARILVMMAEPLNEPIAWGGPIVMNSREELVQAFDELQQGSFIKEGLQLQ